MATSGIPYSFWIVFSNFWASWVSGQPPQDQPATFGPHMLVDAPNNFPSPVLYLGTHRSFFHILPATNCWVVQAYKTYFSSFKIKERICVQEQRHGWFNGWEALTRLKQGPGVHWGWEVLGFMLRAMEGWGVEGGEAGNGEEGRGRWGRDCWSLGE